MVSDPPKLATVADFEVVSVSEGRLELRLHETAVVDFGAVKIQVDGRRLLALGPSPLAW